MLPQKNQEKYFFYSFMMRCTYLPSQLMSCRKYIPLARPEMSSCLFVIEALPAFSLRTIWPRRSVMISCVSFSFLLVNETRSWSVAGTGETETPEKELLSLMPTVKLTVTFWQEVQPELSVTQTV